MKRKFAITVLAVSLTAPANAVAHQVAMVITYVKQALKDKLISYAKQKALDMLSLVPGMPAPRSAISAENTALLQAAGFNDSGAKPFSDADWAEYQECVDSMYKSTPPGTE